MATAQHTEAVKLIVKAPNQLIEDQIIECDLSWTVLLLKEHLSYVYPTQPAISDQKLIYSGQLLSDETVLKDVLRKYEGQKAHSLHLVCAPPRGTPDSWRKSVPSQQLPRISRPDTPIVNSQQVSATPPPASSSSSPPEELPAASSSAESSQAQDGWAWLNTTQQQFLAASQHPAMSMYAPAMWGSQMYDPASLAQMQQAYSQYMAQYLCHLQQAGVSAEVLGSLQAQQWASARSTTTQAARPQGPANPAPADPNAQNNAAAMQPPMVGPDDDEMRMGRQRDWLDWFYVLSRLLVLFSIVYFYSSLKRFVLVSGLGLLLYLYHLGYFRLQNGPAPNNNNRPAREVPPQEAPLPPPAEQQQQEERADFAEAEGLRHRHPGAAPQPEDQLLEQPPQIDTYFLADPPPFNPPSLITIMWTFVSSFFASLIPDRPNVV